MQIYLNKATLFLGLPTIYLQLPLSTQEGTDKLIYVFD